jgi:hypothetical protein
VEYKRYATKSVKIDEDLKLDFDRTCRVVGVSASSILKTSIEKFVTENKHIVKEWEDKLEYNHDRISDRTGHTQIPK